MIKNEILDLYPSENFTKIEYLGENFSVKNITSAILEYKYDETTGKPHRLTHGEERTNIGQEIFVRVRYTPEYFARIEITRGLTQQIAIANLSSGIGATWAIKLDSWGLQKMSQDFRLWRDTFCHGVSSKVWNVKSLNGLATAKLGSGVFSSGSTSGDYYTAFSRKHPRYQPNSGILFSTAGSIPLPTLVGGIRRFGISTIENGYFFELSEDGNFYTVVRQSDFENILATQDQTTFSYEYDILSSSTIYVRVKYAGTILWQDITSDIASIDVTTNEVTMTTALDADDEVCIVSVNDLKNDITADLISQNIDISKQVLYDIQAQWRGAGNVTFIVRSATDAGVHTGFTAVYRNLGQTDRPNIADPALSAMVECMNISADGSNFQLKLGCMNIASEGGQDDVSEYESVVSPNAPTITVDDTDVDEVFLMIAHVPEYYRGRWNTRDCEMGRITAWGDQKCHMNIYSTYNPLFISGALLLKDKVPDSCLQYDNNLNADDSVARNDVIDDSTLEIITRARVEIDSSKDIQKPSDAVETVITAGQFIVLTGQRELSAGAANMGGSIEIGERT